ncbi:MAG: ATP-binding cassette subfamily B protein RaxB [Alteromonadaceae bacterium]
MRNYRSQVAAVMQDDQLLSGSMSDNISFFDEQVDHDWLEQCAKLAAIHDEIIQMPMEYNSLIGDMGTSLSGGQKQRVLLARALYKKPKILFLDEATSHLDVKLESIVNQAIKQLNVTRIIIAHRPETIRSADRIVQLKNGKLYEVHLKVNKRKVA